jgi:hypothetical protein
LLLLSAVDFQNAKPKQLQPWRSRFGAAAVGVWLVLTLVPISALMAGHLLTLPVPESDLALQRLGNAAGGPAASWRVLHVLARRCACSSKVMEALFERGPKAGFAEKILLIGEDAAWQRRASALGYSFESISSAALEEKYGIQGAPLLVVVRPDGRVIYSGGYSPRQQGTIEDVAILDEAVGGGHPAARPLFGCAVSRELQASLDPLGLKYLERDWKENATTSR